MDKQEIIKQKEFIKKIKEINTDKRYMIVTMGCQLNESDSEKIAGMLESMGYVATTNIDDTDIIIFNTCCVRENAEDKIFGKLGEVKRQKEKRGTIIVVCGCMMQEKHIVDKLNESYPFIDIILGTHTLHKLPEDLYKILNKRNKVQDILDIDGEIYEGIPIKRNNLNKASVVIMYGCNNFCSYCIVPYVRGRERSREPEKILNEIKQLAQEGYKEITLLGQNVNSYDGGNGYKFSNLLADVEKIDGIEIIKFISPHPKDFTDDVIDVISKSKKISRIIHLPLQSGSSKVLNKMNRKYTKEQYLNLVQKMKNKIPNVTFSTDIIVGFPGETDEDFEDTLDVVRKVNFEQVFMFIYSKRVGTPAAKAENQVPDVKKHERFNRLKELVEKQMEEQNKKYINTVQRVLVEGISKNNKNMLSGRTDTNKVVVFEGNKDLIGKVIDIKILSEHMWYLKGIV